MKNCLMIAPLVGFTIGAMVMVAHARRYTLLDEPAATATPTATPVSK